MDFKSKNTFKKALTLFSLSVFLIALLVKPIHIIIEHSGRLDITAFQHEKDILVPDHHFDCQICEFEFCLFISQKVFAIPSVHFFTIKDKTPELAEGLTFSTPHCLQLRAPPVI